MHISLQYIAVLFVYFLNSVGNVSAYDKSYSFGKPNDSISSNVHDRP